MLIVVSCCDSGGAAADGDDDDDAAADGAGFVVAVGGAAWGVLVLILVLFSVGAADGATDVSPPNSCPMSGAAELLRPLRGTRVGTVMTGTVGVVSCRTFPRLLDLDSGFGAAGSDAARGGGFVLMLRDLDFDFGAADDDDDDVDGAAGSGGSSFLLLDLAGLADTARFDSNLDAIGAGSIFGAWSPLGTEPVLLLIASALLSLALIGSKPAGGGGGPGGGPFADTVISSFRPLGCPDLPRCNLLICSRRLGFFIADAPAPGGGGGGFCCCGSVAMSSPLGYRGLPAFPLASCANLDTND